MTSAVVRRAAYWRARMGLTVACAGELSSATALEAFSEGLATEDRIRLAREHVRQRIIDDFAADTELLERADALTVSTHEAIALLETGAEQPTVEHFTALETIVAFDGTRPSFLFRDGEVDFASSFSSSPWKTTLSPAKADLERCAACVGRIEVGGSGIGTAFLVAPTLALTNRHVAQAIGRLDGAQPQIKAGVQLNFGGEHRGRARHDVRDVTAILFTGNAPIVQPIDHDKLDLALIEVTRSALSGESAERCLSLSDRADDLYPDQIVCSVGYPADWKAWVPAAFKTRFHDLLSKLLEGDSASKRLAPGATTGMLASARGWTARHDATTLNGNSGSPLLLLDRAGAREAAGLHYGGSWQGERENWAHQLAKCREAVVAPGGKLLGEAFADQGIIH